MPAMLEADQIRGFVSGPVRRTKVSVPGSAWDRTVREALPRSDARQAEPGKQCVPRQSLGTRDLSGQVEDLSYTTARRCGSVRRRTTSRGSPVSRNKAN